MLKDENKKAQKNNSTIFVLGTNFI